MRSLADDLRHRTDLELAALLRTRPDLLHPTPPDLTALAQRAGSSTSVQRALDHLDRFALQVVETIAALPEPLTLNDVLVCFPTDVHEPVATAIAAVQERALLWGGEKFRLVRAVRDSLGQHPGGLGPWGVERYPQMASWGVVEVNELLIGAPQSVLDLLDELMWGPPTGAVANADRYITIESAATPVEWLLARRLLLAQGSSTVFLPREVGIALRTRAVGYPAIIRDLAWPRALPIPTTVLDVDRVNAAAALQAHSFVNNAIELLEAWSQTPPPVLRKGGLAQRDLTNIARTLEVDEDIASVVMEVLVAAGLLARDGEIKESWRPTTDFDSWRADDPTVQWIDLIRAWWTMTRAPHLVRRSEAGSEPINALSDQARFTSLPSLRATVGQLMAEAEPGAVLGAAEVLRCLDDRHPRLSTLAHDNAVRAIVMEAELLGMTGHGALSDMGRCLVDDASDTELLTTLGAHLPDPVEHVLIQGDMTAVAPGPLVPGAAHDLRMLADVESTGGATVYRFSPASLARGFEAGYDADAIERILTKRSLTPLPQALIYLVHDVQRKYGSVRVGLSGSYVRCDDPALMAQVLADAGAHTLGLTAVSDDMLMATAAPVDVLRFLHSLGISALAETPDGQPVQDPTPPKRSPASTGLTEASAVSMRSGPTESVITAVVRSLLRSPEPIADNVHGFDGNDDLPECSTNMTLALIRDAIQTGVPVVIGFVDEKGVRERCKLTPLRVIAGVVTGIDHRDDQVRDLPLARFTGAHRIESAPTPDPGTHSTS